jgi:hypothetical protein
MSGGTLLNRWSRETSLRDVEHRLPNLLMPRHDCPDTSSAQTKSLRDTVHDNNARITLSELKHTPRLSTIEYKLSICFIDNQKEIALSTKVNQHLQLSV